MNKKSLSSFGSVASAVIASLCCAGPVIVAFAGVGSIGAFAIFDTYRPYFVGLTILLLGLSFYLTYRRREVQCDDGSCKTETGGRTNKVAVWTATVVAGVSIAFPYFGGSIFASSEPQLTFATGAYASVTLSIGGMDCEMCAMGLEASLRRVDGVRDARVSFKEGNATVVYDPNVTDEDMVISNVVEVGFSVTHESSKRGRQKMKNEKPSVELLYFDDCPNHKAAQTLLQEVLDEENIEASIKRIRIETNEEAHIHRFVGSPTIRFNGNDVDPSADDRQYSVVCRIYQVNGHIGGLPTKEMIREAVVAILKN